MRIPRVEPPCKCGRFVALFDKDDGSVGVAARRVGLQVFLGRGPRLFGLRLVGSLSNPEENLWEKNYGIKTFELPPKLF